MTKAPEALSAKYFYDHAGATDKTLKLYEGHFHDLLNDVDKEKVMADIQAWLDARIPAACLRLPVKAEKKRGTCSAGCF